MIDVIYIPTYGRVGQQKTYDNLPDKWKEKTYLVVSPDEIHSGYQTISCPIQGKGIAPVRKWIAEHGKEKRRLPPLNKKNEVIKTLITKESMIRVFELDTRYLKKETKD